MSQLNVYLEKSVKDLASNVIILVCVYVWNNLVSPIFSDEIRSGCTSLELVNFETRLVGAEGDQMLSVRAELSQITSRFLDVYNLQCNEK